MNKNHLMIHRLCYNNDNLTELTEDRRRFGGKDPKDVVSKKGSESIAFRLPLVHAALTIRRSRRA